MTATTALLSDLYDDIKAAEHRQAPGSETALWSDYIDAMRRATGLDVSDILRGDFEGVTISADEAAWWREAYSKHEVWLDNADLYDDLQSLYESI